MWYIRPMTLTPEQTKLYRDSFTGIVKLSELKLLPGDVRANGVFYYWCDHKGAGIAHGRWLFRYHRMAILPSPHS
jgi:hypothetical protein